MPPMGPGGFGPPPRKKSPLVPILLAGGGGLVLLIFIIIVVAAVSNSGDSSSSSSSSYSYSYSSYSSFAASSFSYSSSSFATSALPTSSESSTGNEDHTGYGSPEHNKLYSTSTMRGVHCTANLRSNSPSAYHHYADKVTVCLNEAWKQVLTSQGIAFKAPAKVIAANPTSPCGSSNVGYIPMAFYCPTNSTMYFNTAEVKKYPISRYRDWMMETAAHEYGHHVQNLVGIMDVYNQRYYAAQGDVAKATKLSRRTELQPQCLAGMFLSRNAGGMHLSERNQKYSAAHSGDNAVPGWRTHPSYRTHGQFRNSGYWFNRGWNHGRGGLCNTWSASASLVS